MTENVNIECPKCKSKNIQLVKEEEFFDEIFYIRMCMNCGYKIERVTIEK